MFVESELPEHFDNIRWWHIIFEDCNIPKRISVASIAASHAIGAHLSAKCAPGS